jgi:mannose-6-phosphate isomerase-like protein (cupin superfamily)
MPRAVSLEKCFQKFDDLFSPKVVGELNGQQVKLARLEGDKVPWHTHDQEDELFFVVEGLLDIEDRKGKVTLSPGEFCIIPRGQEHRVLPHGHVKLMLFEPAGIAHTGKVQTEITQSECEHLDV